ncbi:MAG: hypothetical protein ABI672_11305 [Vicinamibacteria bacterium]
MREPVGVVSNVNVMPAGPFGSSALSSPSCASKKLIGFTAMNFHEPVNVSPFGPVMKYSARPPALKSWLVNVAGKLGGPQNRSSCRGSA